MRTWVGSTPRKPKKQSAILLRKVIMNLDCVSLILLTWQLHTGTHWLRNQALETDGYWSVEVDQAVHIVESPYVSAPLGH